MTSEPVTTEADAQGRDAFGVHRLRAPTPELALTMRLVLVARRWRSLIDENLRAIEQSSARMEALAAILNSPSDSSQIDIAKRLRIEGPTLTRMIDTLEKDGLVERLPDPNDRRTKLPRVTTEGEAALRRIFAVTDPLRARLLEGLSPATIDGLNATLRDLLARLDKGLPDEEPD